MRALALFACFLAALSSALAQKPVFTEDFESGQLDPKVWEQKVQGTASLKLQQDQVAHGKYALQIHYPEMAQQSFAFLLSPHLPESVKGHLFGRAYVKIDPATPPNHTVLVFAGAAGWPLSKFEEIGVYKNALQPSYQENKSARGQGRGEDVRHGDALPLGKWFLLEWEVNDDPTTLTIWVDGNKTQVTEGEQKVDLSSFQWPKASGTTKGLVGGFEELGFGARVWGPVPQAFDVYYDDIAVGSTRLGPVK